MKTLLLQESVECEQTNVKDVCFTWVVGLVVCHFCGHLLSWQKWMQSAVY